MLKALLSVPSVYPRILLTTPMFIEFDFFFINFGLVCCGVKLSTPFSTSTSISDSSSELWLLKLYSSEVHWLSDELMEARPCTELSELMLFSLL